MRLATMLALGEATGSVSISSATRPYRPIVIFLPPCPNPESLCSHLIPVGDNAGALH
jgi:hypothetical protein